jgi:HSP20 family protein
MSIIRYNPWGAQTPFQDEIRQVFDRFLSEPDADQSNVVTSQWAPRVDIKEEDKRFVIYADIPGVDPKDIEIHMDKGILSIKGERKSESREESERYTRVERAYGSFYRRFALPDGADPEGISATGKHGVLEVVIPKKPEITPRRISVSTH